MISEQTIQQAAQLLGEATQHAKVILFGSYARGEARENSDLDFLGRAQKPSATFLGENVAWEKSTSS